MNLLMLAMLVGTAHPALAQPAGKASPNAAPPLATLPPPPIPKDNPMTPAKVALGKQLFWDARLSGNGSMPCVSCHLPDLGWGDGGAISRGYPGTKHWRNSQTVLNAAYYNKLFWEGNITSLEAQAPAAAEGAVAGNGDGSVMEMRLRFLPEYVEAFRKVFGAEWPRINDAWRAVAAYQRTVVTDAKQVPFDRWLAGDKKALNESQLRGLALYSGKAGCIQCHNGALASDQKFHRLGLTEHPGFKDDPLLQITHRWEHYQKGVPEGRYRDAPMDFNGLFTTLAEVVDFYNTGGGQDPQKSPLLKPLGLSASEKTDLIGFVEALSMDKPLLHEAPKLPGGYQPLAAVKK
jgi:cytochrome c peroxidase